MKTWTRKEQVRSKREMTEKIAAYRREGWNLITLGERLSEMERDGDIIAIERSCGK